MAGINFSTKFKPKDRVYYIYLETQKVDDKYVRKYQVSKKVDVSKILITIENVNLVRIVYYMGNASGATAPEEMVYENFTEAKKIAEIKTKEMYNI